MQTSIRLRSTLLLLLAAPYAACVRGEEKSPTESIAVHDFHLPLDVVDFSNDQSKRATLHLTAGVGSSAFRHRADPPGVFYTISDRGPNIECDEDSEIIGADVCERGRIFPVPSFAPSLYKFRITSGAQSIVLMETVQIKDRSGVAVNGLPNPLRSVDIENAYTRTGEAIAPDVHGLDLEGVVKMSDGSFWLADEYGPGLVHVKATGEMNVRLVPTGTEGELQTANYAVKGVLPRILIKRKVNRGIEALAVSPSEDVLYFIMESVLANPDSSVLKRSRNVRLFRYEMASERITGEFLYRLDRGASFPGADGDTKQSDVKVNDIVALAPDRLLVAEGLGTAKRLYRIDLAAGNPSNIAASIWDSDTTAPSLEQLDDPAAEGVVVLRKDLIVDLGTEFPGVFPKKIEGLTILDGETLLMVNDNDFGIRGDGTRFVTLRFGAEKL